MASIFIIIFFILVFLIPVALIKPDWFGKLIKREVKRRYLVLAIVCLMSVCFSMIGLLAEKPSNSKIIPPKSPSDVSEVKQTVTQKITNKPKIHFIGTIEPSVVNQSDKVVITFEIENLDSKMTVDGMRILFANEEFLTKGLSIVNVMSGGRQTGRAFQWDNDLMKIPPKEKRSFTIVASANQKGSYESIVTFLNPTGVDPFDDQGQELKAKLLVL